MNVKELIGMLSAVPGDREVRIGDQIEEGPYNHAPVGGVFLGTDGDIIICASDDQPWEQEETGIDHDLAVLWSAPSSRETESSLSPGLTDTEDSEET